MSNCFNNNQVSLMGEIVSPFQLNHEVYGEKFYTVDVEVSRFSDSVDRIHLMVSERLVDADQDYSGKLVKIAGQFRSYNHLENGKVRLVLFVFVKEWEFVEDVKKSNENNRLCLDGFVCKQPVYRKTPLGREVADVLIAVNRMYGKSDYIPCICWGRNARFAAGLSVGTRVQITGRIQSREYYKHINEIETERRVAYEVSVRELQVV